MIEIHLDGKPVTKLQAACTVAMVDGQSVDIGEPNASGWIEHGITVYHRRRTLDGDQPAQVHWASYTGMGAADARTFAGMIALGAEVAELAEMIAAEQDAARLAVPHDDGTSYCTSLPLHDHDQSEFGPGDGVPFCRCGHHAAVHSNIENGECLADECSCVRLHRSVPASVAR